MSLIVAILFGLGFATARLARRMIVRGHTYYRRAVYKKTLIEHLLGRFQAVNGFDQHANLAIATTYGMAEANEILSDPTTYAKRRPSPDTVTHLLIRIMELFMVVHATGVVVCVGTAIAEVMR